MASSRPPGGVHAVYALEAPPAVFGASIFLGGSSEEGWREEALYLLKSRGFDGVVLSPEPRPGPESGRRQNLTAGDRDRLHAWQDEALQHCDLILMWLPPEALSDFQVVEAWGQWHRSGKLILGTPLREGPLVDTAHRRRIPIGNSLAELVAMAQQTVQPGAHRRGGERLVPISLWRSPSFQSWYRALTHAGHRLEGVEVEWTHRARGVSRPPFLWAVRPRIQVRGERRQLGGEVVIGRADISATVLYHRPPSAPLSETLVVLVREFRAAVRNRSGFAWMLPGGSAARASERSQDPRTTAAQEVLEETGLRLPPEQLEPVPLGDRQLLASLVSYHAQLFRAALQPEQLAALRVTADAGQPLGATPSERCYVTVRTLAELCADPDLDWSQLGMLYCALAQER